MSFKILFDQQIFSLQEYGGISRYICNLAINLSKIKETQVKVIAPMYINKYLENVPSNIVSGKKIKAISGTKRIINVVNQIMALPEMRSFKPDIFHETFYSPLSFAPKNSHRVITVYDMMHELYPSMFLKRDFTAKWKKIAVKRSEHVICISESTRKDLLEYYDLPENKVSVVHLGFDKLDESEDESCVPAGSNPYILYVGGRATYKNFNRLLQAYARNKFLYDNTRLVCFGGGRFTDSELRVIRELGIKENQIEQVEGDDKILASYYRKAEVFAYPSIYEGFGIPLLEAMSLKCPVVCSNTSSFPEVAGDAGEYFDPANIDSISSAIESVVSSPEKRIELVLRGIERCKLFSWKRCAEETYEIYNGLLK
jgi:glycosyltransferase involved in cell wall biosynthesis